MTQHKTWKITEHHGETIIMEAGSGAHIATVQTFGWPPSDSKAYATLIVAAPDTLAQRDALYKAAMPALEVLEGILEYTDGGDGEMVPNPLLVTLRAALTAVKDAIAAVEEAR